MTYGQPAKDDSSGWLYAVSNPSFPGLLKVGTTFRSVEARVAELSHTGMPYAYECRFSCRVSNPAELKREVCRLLAPYQTKPELFKTSPERIVAAVDSAVLTLGMRILDRPGQKAAAANVLPDPVPRHLEAAISIPVPVPPPPMTRPLPTEGQMTAEVTQRGKASVSLRWVPLAGHQNDRK